MNKIKYEKNLWDNSAVKVGSIRNSTGWYEGTSLKGQGMWLLVPPVSTPPLPKDALELRFSYLS